MIVAADFNIKRAKDSKLDTMSMENLAFGKYFTDHMFEVDYENGNWNAPEIKPYQPLLLSPSLAALHYGQAIFEGIKAYKNQAGEAQIFRPYDNFQRFNNSAKRMEMPEVPADIFIEGMKQLVKIDQNWIPAKQDYALYIRPFMFSSDEMIGVRPSLRYKFMIILSPTGPYYSEPMRIYVEEKYVRAVPGGIGFAKTAGNYAAAMHASAEANLKGYDQVLWTDAFEHKYVEECGTMNFFFVTGNKAITPDLSTGTILEGVTRDSVIQLLKEKGFTIEERKLSIDEIVDTYKKGIKFEVFGTGTAATISMIKELRYKDSVMRFDTDQWKIAPEIKTHMSAIKEGREEDKYNWMMKL